MWEPQFGPQQRVPLFDLVEPVPGEATAVTAATAQHPAPVTLHGLVYLDERPEVPGDAVVGVVAAQGSVDVADLITDRMMPCSPHQLLQRREAAPQARFLGAHPHLEVAFSVSRAIQRQAQKVDGLRAVPAALASVSLREPAKLDQLGLGRL